MVVARIFMLNVLFLIHFSCNNNTKIDPTFVNNKMWVYDVGLRFGGIDIINTSNEKYFICREDTLFFQNLAFAKIVSIDKENSVMVLKSLKNDSTGRYIDLNEFSGDPKQDR